MKRSRFTESQILAVLRWAKGGRLVCGSCREHGISTATFYKWRSNYGGMDASMVSQMKALEEENRRLKRMYAELNMQANLLKEALGKNDAAISTPGDGLEGGGGTWCQHCARLSGIWCQRDLLPVQPKA